MGQTTGASNTQKQLMISLAEGWMLRYVDLHGWCLFMPNRGRPFARVKKRTVDQMTAKGWLTPGIATKGLGYRPAKELTALGRKYADRLMGKGWGLEEEWDPFDQRETKKELKPAPVATPAAHARSVPEKSSTVVEPNLSPVSPLHSSQPIDDASHVSEAYEREAPAPDANDATPPEAITLRPADDGDDEQPRFRLVA